MERGKNPMQRNPSNFITQVSGLAPHVVFTGGEAAGNLFPGLAVAESLRQLLPQIQITFTGAGSRIERREVQAADFAYRGLPCPAWPSSWSGIWRYFKDQRQAVHVAGEFIRQTGVVSVVGLGGAASLPISKAAARAGVALALLEQNAVPGKATQKLCHSASLVCLSFTASRHRLTAAKRVVITGGPVRLDRSKATAEQPRGSRILITGGMSGRGRFELCRSPGTLQNRAIRAALADRASGRPQSRAGDPGTLSKIFAPGPRGPLSRRSSQLVFSQRFGHLACWRNNTLFGIGRYRSSSSSGSFADKHGRL